LAQVCDDVRLRLASVLSRWADGPTRTHLLLVGQEEGQHYAPGSVPDDVRALVVVAVRNSLLEELCTSASRLVPAGESIIGDEQLAAITGEAVHFWRHLPLAPTSASVGTPAGDPFGHLARAYPHAYHVLDALASSPAPIVRFAACTAPPPPLLDSPSGGSVPARGVPPLRVGSGWDPALDDDLLAALHGVHAGTLGGLVLPTWKHCTRNTDKLYRVLDYVLGHGGRVVTVNYLLTPTYACRRVPLLKPAHDSRAVGLQVRDRTRLQPEHAQALEETWPAWAALEVADDER
jgi:hypothetical protein